MGVLHKHLPLAVVLGAVVLAYSWLQSPVLTGLSLQAFAATTLAYLVLKRLKKAKFWHIVPSNNTAEIGLLTFAFLLLIGATGNTSSPFFALGYVHLFLLVLSVSVPAALVATTGVLLFHIALTPNFTQESMTALITLPLLLLFFLFAKKQYDEAQAEKQLLELDARELQQLQNSELELEVFLGQFLQPKLKLLEEIAQDQSQFTTLKNQISLLNSEISKLLQKKSQVKN